jgi:hypothetical protein
MARNTLIPMETSYVNGKGETKTKYYPLTMTPALEALKTAAIAANDEYKAALLAHAKERLVANGLTCPPGHELTISTLYGPAVAAVPAKAKSAKRSKPNAL